MGSSGEDERQSGTEAPGDGGRGPGEEVRRDEAPLERAPIITSGRDTEAEARLEAEINEARSKARLAGVVGLIWAATEILGRLAARDMGVILTAGRSGLIRGAIVACLAYGVYHHSRACAVLLLIFFLVIRVNFALHGVITPFSALTTVFLVYVYWRGAQGAFQMHRLKRGR